MSITNNNYREFRLDNGLLVALQETPTLTVSGKLRVFHGALNEKQGEEGIAHFLEHVLVYGGSQRYSPEMSDKIAGRFGSFNAFTSLDETFFPVGMLAEDTPLFLEYISDVVFNPRFEKTRMEEERQRVLRETADYKSNPAFKDDKVYWEKFFGKDSPHRYPILGDESVVSSAEVKDLKEFHIRGYHPNNMNLILVGTLPKNIEDLINENFGSFPRGSGKRFEFPENNPIERRTVLHTFAPELYNEENPMESCAKLNISLNAPTEKDKDKYTISLLAMVLGEGTDSRLFKSVSKEKGLAYDIGARYENGKNNGGLHISGSIHSVKADEAIDSVFEEMTKLRTELVSQDKLDVLKRTYRYALDKTFETNEGRINSIEYKMNRGLTLEDFIKLVDKVTPKEIRDVAVKYLPKNRNYGKYVLSLRDPLKK